MPHVKRTLDALGPTGARVLFIDSDMVLEEGVISEGLRALQDSDVRGVVIPELSFGDGFWTRCRILERQCYAGDDDVEAARLFRRADFLETGGFDLELNGAEDWDLSTRVAGRSGLPRTSSIIHHDEGRISLGGTFVKRRYYAGGYLHYLAKHRGGALTQANVILRPAFLRHWKDLLRHPFLAGGMFLLKMAEFAAVAEVAVQQWVMGRAPRRSEHVYRAETTTTPGAPTADGQRHT